MAVLTFAIFGAGVPPVMRLILCMIYSFIGGLIPANLFLLVPRYAPDLRHVSIGNGILMQGSAVGQTLGAPIVAALVTQAGGLGRCNLANAGDVGMCFTVGFFRVSQIKIVILSV